MVKVLRIDLDLAGGVEVGITQRLQVAVVGGGGGEHGRLHQVGQVVLAHVELDGLLEGCGVDLQRALHLAAQLGEALLHLTLDVLAYLGHQLGHGRLHRAAQLSLQRLGDLGRVAFHEGGHRRLHGLRELGLQGVLVEQFAHGVVHQGLEGIALEVLGEADLVQVQDAVPDDIVLVADQNLLGQLLHLVFGDGKVHVGKEVGQGAHVQIRRFGQIQIQLEIVGVEQRAEIDRTVVQIECTAEVEIQLAGVELEGALEHVGVDAEQAAHIKGGSVFGAEGFAVHHVDRGGGQLVFDHLRVGCGGDDVLGEGGRVGDAGGQHGSRGILFGLHDAHHGQGLAGCDKALHEVLVVGLVHPGVVVVVAQIAVGRVDQFELDADEIAVPIGLEVGGDIDVLVLGELLDHLVQLGAVPQAEGVQRIVGDGAVGTQHGNAFVVLLRPAARLDFVLGVVEFIAFGQLIEHTGVHHGGHHAVGGACGADAQAGEGGIRVHLTDGAIGVFPVDLGLHIVRILDGGGIFGNGAVVAFEIGLEGLQVVGGDARHHLGDELPHRDHPFLGGRAGSGCRRAGGEHRGQVHAAAENLQRIFGQGGAFGIVDILVDACRQGDDERDADDADGTGKGREQGAGLFGQQIVEAQAQRGEGRHGRAAHALVHRRGKLGGVRLEGVGVGADDAVLQLDDAGGVLVGQLRVVGDHDDEAVFGHFLQQLHDLDAGLAVQCAGGLVGQQDVRVVDEGAGDGHPLHLAAGHLGGVLVQLVAQTHFLQCLGGPAAALGTRYAGDGQCQLHVGQHGLVGDEVVALEHKADGVVAVGVPVAVGVLFGGDAVDDEVAAVVPVQTADDVQQGGLAGAAGAKDGDELAVAEVQADLVKGCLDQVAGLVLLVDLFELKHGFCLSANTAEGSAKAAGTKISLYFIRKM